MGKSGSLTCYLDFPDSCVLDSIKWYKVKRNKPKSNNSKKNLSWCYFLLLYKIHFLFMGKLSSAGCIWYFVCLSQQVVVALIIILKLWLLLFCNTVPSSLYLRLSIFRLSLLSFFIHIGLFEWLWCPSALKIMNYMKSLLRNTPAIPVPCYWPHRAPEAGYHYQFMS